MKSRKLTGYVLTAFLAYFTITNPTLAGHLVREAGTGIGTFVSVLTGGAQ